MRTLIVIPARYQSSRFPGKPLTLLKGATGVAKSLVQRAWEAAKAVPGDNHVVVATDDQRIADATEGFGGEVVFTSEHCRNGTERVAEAFDQLGSDAEVVVNLQGDAPLTPPGFVAALVNALQGEKDAAVATPVLRCDPASLSGFQEDRRAGRVGGTTAVFDQQGRAMYFSKEVLPYTGRSFDPSEVTPVFHHVGVYAFRPESLRAYASWDPGELETWEGLEQLRFMENGTPVFCVEVAAEGRAFWEVNNPVDVERVEKILQEQGYE